MATKRKAVKTKITEQTQRAVMTEMADFLSTLPDINEAFTRADIELALDDRGWLTPGRQWTSADLDNQTRTTMVAKSRLYWNRDPLMKQSVRLWTDYSLANGITYTAEGDAQKKLDAFMKHRRNRNITNSEGQRRSSKKLLVDGELFFAIFTSEDPHTIRRIDPLQITDIICDPDDEEHVLGYKRDCANNKTLFYADWRCDDTDLELLSQQKDPATKGIINPEKDVVVYHLAFDTLLKRGNGLLFSVCDWSKEHRRFVEARVAITAALAKFAWKSKVKGGQAVVNQMVRKLQSTYTQSGATQVERNPTNAPGGTWVENDGVDLTPMPRVTGGAEASVDGNQLKLMVSAGTGIMLHYFGDPSTGNLATATAMELPMLKMFESYQQLWIDAYRDLFGIALDEDPDDDPTVIDIDLPPILAADLQKLSAFLTSISTMFPELKVREVLQMCLVSLGVNNIDEVMKAIDAKRVEIDKQQAELAKQQAELAKQQAAAGNPAAGNPAAGNPAVNPGGAVQQKRTGQAVPVNPQSNNESALLIEALTRFADLLDAKEATN